MFEEEEDPIRCFGFEDVVLLVDECLIVVFVLDVTTTFFFLTGAGLGSGAAHTSQLPPELQCLHPEQFLHAVQ